MDMFNAELHCSAFKDNLEKLKILFFVLQILVEDNLTFLFY